MPKIEELKYVSEEGVVDEIKWTILKQTYFK